MPGAPVHPFLVILGQCVYYGVSIYVWLIILRVLLTWISPNPYSPLMRLLSRITDPLLNQARRRLPFTLGGLDFSPVLVIIVIHLAGVVLGQWLISLGHGGPPLMLAPLAALGLISLLDSIAWLLVIVMAARLLMSLVRPSPYNIIVQIVYGLTEPLLAPLRRFFPPGPRGMDWRPLVFLAVTLLVQRVLLASLSAAALEWIRKIAATLA